MGKLLSLCLAAILASAPAFGATVLLEEHFDDGNFAGRGWYGNTGTRVTTSQAIPGSKGSAEYRFRTGAKAPDYASSGMRHKFSPSESVYLRYWVKYSDNWVGSNRPYHPHEFHFLTNKDSDWTGPASTYTTFYVEQNAGQLQFFFQDSKNIDTSRIKQDLTNITERRGVAGCNGDTDGFKGGCYLAGDGWRNEKYWKNGKVNFSSQQGPNYKGDWHLVEAYVKMNSIVNGKGVTDGIIRMWFDGNVIINHEKVLIRTATNADMRFNQFMIGPWIGDGSPVDQTMWLDELLIATDRILADGGAPNPPVLLEVK